MDVEKQAAAHEDVADRDRVHHLEALAPLQHRADEVRHAAQVGRGRRHVEHGRDGDLDAPAGDARAVLGLRLRLVGRGDERRHREFRLHAAHLGPAEHVLVATERPAGERVRERRALAEDRVLLPHLRPTRGADVQEDLVAVERHDDALDGLEGLDELVGHQRERSADAVGETGGGRPRGHGRRGRV